MTERTLAVEVIASRTAGRIRAGVAGINARWVGWLTDVVDALVARPAVDAFVVDAAAGVSVGTRFSQTRWVGAEACRAHQQAPARVGEAAGLPEIQSRCANAALAGVADLEAIGAGITGAGGGDA